MLSDWVSAGGNLIAHAPRREARRPARDLGPRRRHADDANLSVDTSTAPGRGHHERRACSTTAPPTATRSTAPTAVAHPRATGNAGRDPAQRRRRRSRRGLHLRPLALGRRDPPGQPRLGGPGARRRRAGLVRSDDMFFGNAASGLPMARPLPRDGPVGRRAAAPAGQPHHRDGARRRSRASGTCPTGCKAAVVLTGDDHGRGGTERHRAAVRGATWPPEPPAARWPTGSACARPRTSTPTSPAGPAPGSAATIAQGFEVALHLQVNRPAQRLQPVHVARRPEQPATPTSSTQLRDVLAEPAAPRPPAPTASCGATSTASRSAELQNGIRLDTNYYYWPGSWVGQNAGPA